MLIRLVDLCQPRHGGVAARLGGPVIPADALCLVTHHILPVIVSMPQMQHPDGIAAHRRLVIGHKAILPLLCVQKRVHRRRVGLALEV